MRDTLVQTTTALTGSLGTTVNSSSIGLGHDAAKTAVGSPIWYGYEMEVYFPSNPTGTSPSILATVQDSLDDVTFVNCTVLAPTDTATTGYPKNVSHRFFTRPKAKSVRMAYVLANTDNVYGSVVASLVSGNRTR